MSTQIHIIKADPGHFTVHIDAGVLFRDLPILGWRVEVAVDEDDDVTTWVRPLTYGESINPYAVLYPDGSVTDHVGSHFDSLADCQRDVTSHGNALNAIGQPE